MNELKQLLIDDFENRKEFEAHFDQQCEVCGEEILEGDALYFVGNKRVCAETIDVIVEYLKDSL